MEVESQKSSRCEYLTARHQMIARGEYPTTNSSYPEQIPLGTIQKVIMWKGRSDSQIQRTLKRLTHGSSGPGSSKYVGTVGVNPVDFFVAQVFRARFCTTLVSQHWIKLDAQNSARFRSIWTKTPAEGLRKHSFFCC